MIEAIFYARFDQEEGPVITHQSPPYSITQHPGKDGSPEATANSKPIVDFNAISAYVIPPQEFCDRLVSIVSNGYRVLGHPVCITDERYPRNEFIFNFVLVIREYEEFEQYERLVRKLAELGREIEVRDGWLSKDEEATTDDGKDRPPTSRMPTLDAVESHESTASAPSSSSGSRPDRDSRSSASEDEDDADKPAPENQDLADLIASTASHEPGVELHDVSRKKGSRVSALCEMLMEDLNGYGECLIRIDPFTTLNTKLFPSLPNPPPIKSEQVPLPTVRPLSRLTDSNWDLTLLRILPYIDGINSVAQIAENADADLKLTRIAIAHLVYYGAAIMIDIFHFGAVYAPTRLISKLLLDTRLLDECVRFSRQGPSGGEQEKQPVKDTERDVMVELYTTLKHGVALRSWVAEHWSKVQHLDIRRFITIGLVKGLITRIHRYPVLITSTGNSAPAAVAASDGTFTASSNFNGAAKKRAKKEPTQTRDLRFAPYLDGLHSLDRICTDLHMPERKALEELKRWGDVQIIHR